MIKIKYERYWNDHVRKDEEKTSTDLNAIQEGSENCCSPLQLKPRGSTAGITMELTFKQVLDQIIRRTKNLNLRGTGIDCLPEDLKTGENLDLRGTGVTALPEGLTVSGDLDLRNTKITSLPEDLTVPEFRKI